MSARVLALGVALGVLADRLLWEGPIGPGLTLWIAALGGAATYVAWQKSPERGRATGAWSLVAVAAAAGTAWRGSPVLVLCFFLAVVLAASVALLRARGVSLGRTRVRDHIYGLALVPWQAGMGGLPLVMGLEPPQASAGRTRAVAMGRGLVLALPLLIVFGLLFMSADPWLERQAERLVTALDTLPAHLLLLIVFAWIATGLLAGLIPGLGNDDPARDGRGSDLLTWLRLPRIGAAEATVVLGLVAALFAVFVGSQFRYMFGGAAAIEAISGLTLAEYARRGFFELVVVAGLTLALLLAVDATVPRDRDDGRRGRVRWLSGALVALVLPVIASAALRLRLYVDSFGLTTARVYAAAVMIWLTITLLLFAATVLRGRGRPFASAAFIGCLATIFGLGVLNPDATVARVNLERASTTPVDTAYLAQLGPDAAPVLAARLDRLPAEDRCRLVATLRDRWLDDEPRDWRTWNAARSAARDAVAGLPPCPEEEGGQGG